MKKNMGNADRIIRILIAVAVGVLYFVGAINGTLALILLLLSGIFIITGMVGFCPLYAPFRISTIFKKSK